MRRRKRNEEGQEVCKNGHPITPDNTNRHGSCKTCKVAERAEWAQIHRPSKAARINPAAKTTWRVEVWRARTEVCRSYVEVEAVNGTEARTVVQESIDLLDKPTYMWREGERPIDEIAGTWEDDTGGFKEGEFHTHYVIKGSEAANLDVAAD